MKILQIVNLGYPAGGAEISVKFLRDELTKRGHSVKVLSSDIHGDEMFSDYQFKAISQTSRFKIFQHLFYLSSLRKMQEVIKEFGPDIIHIHTIGFFSPSILFGLNGIPTAMTIHGPEEFTLKLLPWFLPRTDYKENSYDPKKLKLSGILHYSYYRLIQRPIYRLGLRNIKIFIAPSKFLADIVQGDVPAKKIHQIYNGILLAHSKPLPNNLNVLYVGRLEKVKGVDFLITAFKNTVDAIPQATLTIVGDGSCRIELEQLTKKLNLENNIQFAGWVKAGKEILEEYENSVMLAIPSIWPENLPTVCIEAIAMGRAIVGTHTGGIPELIEEGKTGYIVPIKNSEKLGDAIITLLGDRKTLESMGQSASREAERFDILHFADQIENVYKELSI